VKQSLKLGESFGVGPGAFEPADLSSAQTRVRGEVAVTDRVEGSEVDAGAA